MTTLTLVNDSVPAFIKPDPAAWIEATPVQKNAQAIYSHLQKAGDAKVITLGDLSTGLGIGYMSAYWASRRLVLGGFATKEEVVVAAPTKRNPDKTEIHIGLRFIKPWEKKPTRAPKW